MSGPRLDGKDMHCSSDSITHASHCVRPGFFPCSDPSDNQAKHATLHGIQALHLYACEGTSGKPKQNTRRNNSGEQTQPRSQTNILVCECVSVLAKFRPCTFDPVRYLYVISAPQISWDFSSKVFVCHLSVKHFYEFPGHFDHRGSLAGRGQDFRLFRIQV